MNFQASSKHTWTDTHLHIRILENRHRYIIQFPCFNMCDGIVFDSIALKMAMWLSGINMSDDCLPLTRHFLSTHIPPFECGLDGQTKKQKQINWEAFVLKAIIAVFRCVCLSFCGWMHRSATATATVDCVSSLDFSLANRSFIWRSCGNISQ